MSIEARPMGQKCKETLCSFCYQKGNKDFPSPELNLQDFKHRIKQAVQNSNENSFVLYGGDAGAYPADLRHELIKWGCAEFGHVGMQTGGWWITKKEIEWMKQFDIRMGLSIDGPWPLNEKRVLKNKESTKEYTDRLMGLLPRISHLFSLGIIVTLHNSNVGSPERYETLKKWIKWLDEINIGGRLHLLQKKGGEYVPSYIYKGVLLDLAEFMENNIKQSWTPFRDFKNIITGNGHRTCYWNKCDPYHTKAVFAVDRDGISVCSRNFKEGLRPLKAKRMETRQDILGQIPEEKGGCKGCKWFPDSCNGGCSGTSEGGDWRNKTIYCSIFKAMLNYYQGKYQGGSKSLSEKPQDPTYHEDQGTIHEDSDATRCDPTYHEDGGMVHEDSDAERHDPTYHKDGGMIHEDSDAGKDDPTYHEDQGTIHKDSDAGR